MEYITCSVDNLSEKRSTERCKIIRKDSQSAYGHSVGPLMLGFDIMTLLLVAYQQPIATFKLP